MTHNAESAISEVRLFECQECGQLTKAGEFHSYESCILYLLEHNPERINDQHRKHVWWAGEQAMKRRVKNKVVFD